MNRRLVFDLTLVILIAALYRVIPHVPNGAPVAALALYSGVNLDKRVAIFLPLSIMLLSDLIIGFHGTMVFVYGAFLLTAIIGILLKKHQSLRNILGATLVSSTLFFLITNFGVWTEGRMYPKTFEGLVTCYYMALPFFRNTLLGDMGYAGLFFGSHAIVQKIDVILNPVKNLEK